MSNFKLDKVIVVDNVSYDINAKYADEAGKVKSTLTIKAFDSETNTIKDRTYDGSASVQIDKVAEANSASTAGKVENTLTIKAFVNGNAANLNYNGDEAVTINKVAEANHADAADTAGKVENTLTISVYENSQVIDQKYNGDEAITISKVAQANIADKVAHALTFEQGGQEIIFDGSQPINIELAAGGGGIGGAGDEIKVNMDNNVHHYASISIKSSDPTGGAIGDIWFKY
jgi:hypothetical protein